MGYARRYTQHPSETRSYDVSFEAFLAGNTDAVASMVVRADAGIAVLSSAPIGKSVRMLIAGGVSGRSYEVAVSITTQGGRTKLEKILIRLRNRSVSSLAHMTPTATTGLLYLDAGILTLDSLQLVFT